VHPEAPATARWSGGTRIVASHANGASITTDMPEELGGTGNDVEVTPGWLFRAGFASCAATCIAMGAAARGIELASLEVTAKSRSDLRGLFGMSDADGTPVPAGPRDVELIVRIRAPGVDRDRLRAMVEERYRCSPIASAVANSMPVDLSIVIDDEKA
jgi:organic hydroperoxide reductase OsmC/OhrA